MTAFAVALSAVLFADSSVPNWLLVVVLVLARHRPPRLARQPRPLSPWGDGPFGPCVRASPRVSSCTVLRVSNRW